MGLVLPQKVKIKWNGTSKQHYVDLGYSFSKQGDEFEVDVNDLSKGSCVLVKIECDYCNDIVNMEWKQYLSLKGKSYCCQECMKHKKKAKDKNGNLIYIEIPYRNREWLYNEYIIKGREAKDMAEECGINQRTLREWISTFDFPRKNDKAKELTKDVLYDLYRVQRKTSLEIAEQFGLSDSAILYWFNKYNIPIYSRSEIVKFYLYKKGGIEKARKKQSTMENRIKSSCRQHNIDIEDFIGFSTTEQHMARNNTYYKEWKNKIFERDNYTCRRCGKRGGNLNAHHLYNFSEHPDLRYDVNNGITLCEECHLINYPNSFHSIYGERHNTPEQIYEFINNKKEEVI